MFRRSIALMLLVLCGNNLYAMESINDALFLAEEDGFYFRTSTKKFWLPTQLVGEAQSPLFNELMQRSLSFKKKKKEKAPTVFLNVAPNVVELAVYFLWNHKLPVKCASEVAIEAERIFQIPALSNYLPDNLIVRWDSQLWGPVIYSSCKICTSKGGKTKDEYEKFGKLPEAIMHLKEVHRAKIKSFSETKKNYSEEFTVTFDIPVYYKTFLEEQAEIEAKAREKQQKEERKKRRKEKKKISEQQA